MVTKWLKDISFAIGDWIEGKLNTVAGKLTLLIMASMATAGSLIFAFNKQSNYEEVILDRDRYKKSRDSLQIIYNLKVQNADRECDEKSLQSAIVHAELQRIYSNRTAEDQAYVEEQIRINREKRKEAVKEKKQLKELKTLSNEP